MSAAPCDATRLFLAKKSPLTNRIGRHFAGIKAVRRDCGPRQTKRRVDQDIRRRKSGHFEDESQDISKTKVRTFRRRKSGHFEDESQDISKTKVRKRRDRRRERPSRPPSHCR